jgi:uncharacterized protein YndB with AHSA1/START domain
MKCDYQIDIAAPIEKVFALLRDKDRFPLWLEGVEDTTYTADFDPENPIGARFVQRIREGRQVQDYDGEVTAYSAPNHLGIRLAGKHFAVNVDYRLTSIATGTRLDYSCVVNCGSWFVRVMGFLFRWFTRLIVRKQLRKLKALAETGT